MVVVISQFTGTIGGSGRCIYQGDLFDQAVIPYLLRVFQIQPLMNGIVKFCRIRPGSEVKNKPDIRLLRFKPLEKIIPFNPVNIFFPFKVIYFIQAAELIYQDQLFKSLFIQKTRQAAANKTGGSGNNNNRRLGSCFNN